jgi:hypothetical protein
MRFWPFEKRHEHDLFPFRIKTWKWLDDLMDKFPGLPHPF